MALQKSPEKEQKNDKSMIFQREEFMISLNDDSIPKLRNANFLKPMLNTTKIQQFPKKPLYFTSNPDIFNDLKKKIKFKGIKSPRVSWKNWVENLEKTHQNIWKKVGIFDAIKASTYRISKDVMLIMYLAQKWCVETNTFVFSWGECSITLEDVMILGGFSVLGDSVISCFGDRSCEELTLENKLEGCCAEIRRKNFGHLALSKWLEYFEGKGGELEHVACLVMWLSRYVFCTDCADIDTDVFALAIRLAKGTRIALGCGVLASIYRDLSLLKRRIIGDGVDGVDGSSSLDLWSPFQLVQVWAWERFRTVSPKPLCLVRGETRIARWHNVGVLKYDSSRLRMDEGFSEELFLWRPYGSYLENWDFPKFYGDEGTWVVMNSEVDDEFLSFAKCLRDCKLEGVNCVELYLPHRVGMQFGLDQDVPDFVPRKIPNLKFDGISCYVPPRLLEGDVTVRYLNWWRGSSTSYDDEVLIACPSLKSHSRKLNIRFKGVRPQDYPSLLPCNEPMQVDSVSSKEILTPELAPVENLASQSHECLVLDSAVQDGNTSEHIPGSETHIVAELVERVCGDMENTSRKTPLRSSTPCDTPICTGLDRSDGEIREEIPPSDNVTMIDIDEMSLESPCKDLMNGNDDKEEGGTVGGFESLVLPVECGMLENEDLGTKMEQLCEHRTDTNSDNLPLVTTDKTNQGMVTGLMSKTDDKEEGGKIGGFKSLVLPVEWKMLENEELGMKMEQAPEKKLLQLCDHQNDSTLVKGTVNELIIISDDEEEEEQEEEGGRVGAFKRLFFDMENRISKLEKNFI